MIQAIIQISNNKDVYHRSKKCILFFVALYMSAKKYFASNNTNVTIQKIIGNDVMFMK